QITVNNILFRKLSGASVIVALGVLAFPGTAVLFAGTEPEVQQAAKPEEENSQNLFNYETTYTFRSDFEESKLGHGDSVYNDFSYDHRFLLKGRWYFRAAVSS